MIRWTKEYHEYQFDCYCTDNMRNVAKNRHKLNSAHIGSLPPCSRPQSPFSQGAAGGSSGAYQARCGFCFTDIPVEAGS